MPQKLYQIIISVLFALSSTTCSKSIVIYFVCIDDNQFTCSPAYCIHRNVVDGNSIGDFHQQINEHWTCTADCALLTFLCDTCHMGNNRNGTTGISCWISHRCYANQMDIFLEVENKKRDVTRKIEMIWSGDERTRFSGLLIFFSSLKFIHRTPSMDERWELCPIQTEQTIQKWLFRFVFSSGFSIKYRIARHFIEHLSNQPKDLWFDE